jgi:predicted pyridoxine 5'-phosphate oxidase superfamily flavin-nucleotide-binding protein
LMRISNILKKMIESNIVSLSTIGKDNYPHTIYVACVKVISNNKLLVTDNYMVKTKENILNNSKVSVTLLIENIGYELKGEASYFFDGKYFKQIKNIFENNGLPCKGAILINIKNIKKMA